MSYWDNLSEKVMNIGKMFDDFAEKNDTESTKSLIEYVELILEIDDFFSLEKFQLYYSLGVAYSDIYQVESENYELLQEKEILNYRKALNIYESEELEDLTMLPQLYINLGNAYFNTGRVFDSLSYYDLAIDIVSDHPMASGCKGITLENIARMIYDDRHKEILFHEAYQCISFALDNREIYPHPKAYEKFEGVLKHIERYFDREWLKEKINFEEYDLGDDEEEKYRVWCLKNNLYINELNEIIKNSATAHDPLHIPTIITSLDFDSRLHGFMNQIKQDYVSTRYLFYHAIQEKDEVHFSDKHVHQVNTFDYATHSLSDFQIKLAFKSAHSLFDKIAFFINEYFEIGIREKDIDFNTIWKEGHGFNKRRYRFKKPINKKIAENLALKGLYWMAKDFYPVFNSIIEPKSKIIKDIRNHLEHKYVKTVGFKLEPGPMQGDNLAYYLSADELSQYTQMVLKLSRDAIINLIMAIYVEEVERRKKKEDALTVPINLPPIDDTWKL